MFPCSSHIRLLHQRFFSLIPPSLTFFCDAALLSHISSQFQTSLCQSVFHTVRKKSSRHCCCEQMRRDFNSNDTWNSNTEILSVIMHRGIRKENQLHQQYARQFIPWKLLWCLNVKRSMMITLVNCISTSLYRSFVQFFNINAIIVTKRVRNTHTIAAPWIEIKLFMYLVGITYVHVCFSCKWKL